MTCHNCSAQCKKFGKNKQGVQRYRCKACAKVILEPQDKPLDAMRLPLGKAVVCLRLLVEGNSIRSVERLTGIHRDTILRLLVLCGQRCERFLEDRIKAMPVYDVQCDEIWGFVGMKEKTKKKQIWDIDSNVDQLGDAYCFVAFERNTKMILTWHLGRRTFSDTWEFTKKLAQATADSRFQVTTDGFASYRDTIVHELGYKGIDFAQLIKVYAAPQGDERRYSPPEVVDVFSSTVFGNPNPERVCTSHVERQNLNIRHGMKRMARLTLCFSKKWENLKAMYAIYFAFYNFCRVHRTIKETPAMAAKLTDHVWSLTELLAA
jgi:transposase-like protein/IS1 family transposase